MNAPEFFDCDFAQDLLERECDGMPKEFQVDATGVVEDGGTYVARWTTSEKGLAEDPADVEKCRAAKEGRQWHGYSGVWFNEEGGCRPSSCEVLDAEDVEKLKSKGGFRVLDSI